MLKTRDRASHLFGISQKAFQKPPYERDIWSLVRKVYVAGLCVQTHRSCDVHNAGKHVRRNGAAASLFRYEKFHVALAFPIVSLALASRPEFLKWIAERFEEVPSSFLLFSGAWRQRKILGFSTPQI